MSYFVGETSSACALIPIVSTICRYSLHCVTITAGTVGLALASRERSPLEGVLSKKTISWHENQQNFVPSPYGSHAHGRHIQKYGITPLEPLPNWALVLSRDVIQVTSRSATSTKNRKEMKRAIWSIVTGRLSGPSTATSVLTNAASRCIILLQIVKAYSKCFGDRAATGHQRTLRASALHRYLNVIRKTTTVSGRPLNHRTPAKPPVSVFDAIDYCSPYIKGGSVFVAKRRETKEHTGFPGLAQSRMLWGTKRSHLMCMETGGKGRMHLR